MDGAATFPGAQTGLQRGHRLDIDSVRLGYGGTPVVQDVSLTVAPGEFVALLGPSGCGKTTLLRAIAGFLRPSDGLIAIDRRSIDDLPPGRRNVGIVFQNYALFPNLSVAENVAYGLRARRTPRAETARRVTAALDAVRMTEFAHRLPRALSGGQQQRVALARAIATEPSVLLLDEPFAALDRALRLDLQLEIRRLQRRLALTTVMVTHDQDEAMSMADRVAVMRAGRLEQVDEPARVYDEPASLFVAGFVGESVMLAGRVAQRSATGCEVVLRAGATLIVPAADPPPPATDVVVAVRPEQLMLHDAPAADRIPAELRQSAPLGAALVHDITAAGVEMKVTEPRRGPSRPPGPVHVGLVPSARPALFPASGESA
ncbi:MAG: ABC transporter ATP-binding protein [Acetobacteraceae bacterium]